MLDLLTTKNNVTVPKRTNISKLLVAVLLLGCSFVAQSQCPTPSGDQTSYGSGSWIGYVYNEANNFNTANYKGYVTQTEFFDQDVSTGSISGSNLCGSYADRFSVRYKMQKTMAPGNYTFTVGGDDGYRLSFDGGITFPINNWNDHSYTSTSITYYLSGVVNFVLEYYENGGYSRISYSSCNSLVNPSLFGSNVWNVYGFNASDITLASGACVGYYTSNSLNFDTQTGTNSWSNILSPSASAGWVGCPLPNDYFTMTAKRKGFPCGTYTLAMQNWDDVAQVYLNGTLIWSVTCCGTSTNSVIGSYNLDSNSEIEIRLQEYAGHAYVGLGFTNTNVASTAPTTLSGTTSLCGAGSTTLTASGGTLGSTGSYQWGTGAVGTNIIAGQTAASLTASLSTSTTYWVRRVDSTCSNTTSEISQLVTAYSTTVAGTLSSTATTICANTTPSDIVLTGNNGTVVKWQSANNSAFTSGLTDIASTSTTLTGAMMGAISATKYYRAVVQNGSCTVKNTTGIKLTVPAAVTYNGSWSGTPTATSPVTISGNLTLTSDLNVCSCQVTGTAVITVPANKTLVVQKDISIASTATIVIENDGSLIQVDDNANTIGNVTFKRNTTPLKQYDYTYWSSPIVGQTLNILGTPSFFYSFNPTVNNWVYEAGTNTMTAAKGYIARAPNNLNFSTPQVVATTFNGTPNNGVINTPIIKMSGLTYNLIGNPYPSAIDIDAFLLDPANSNIVNGTIYLWTHNTAISNSMPGNQVYNYTRDDYAKYNLTGGVKTASSALSGGVTPTGKVAAGQGFFIEANSALANGTYQATFKNYMRVSGNNNQFFKFTNLLNTTTIQTETQQNTIEKNRVWLSISTSDGAYDEALVGYMTGATDNLDNLYDGKTMIGGNVVSLYSKLGTTDLAIQGKALPFNENDVIPLGIRTTISGNFTIALDNFDGLFENQNVYLFDKTSQTYYDLKAQNYTFNIATSGIYNDRFELRYTNGALTNNSFDLEDNGIQIIRKDKHVAVKSTETINKIEVVDILGKLIYSKSKINANEFNTSDLNISSQIVIVKVTLENDMTISRKVIMN